MLVYRRVYLGLISHGNNWVTIATESSDIFRFFRSFLIVEMPILYPNIMDSWYYPRYPNQKSNDTSSWLTKCVYIYIYTLIIINIWSYVYIYNHNSMIVFPISNLIIISIFSNDDNDTILMNIYIYVSSSYPIIIYWKMGYDPILYVCIYIYIQW